MSTRRTQKQPLAQKPRNGKRGGREGELREDAGTGPTCRAAKVHPGVVEKRGIALQVGHRVNEQFRSTAVITHA